MRLHLDRKEFSETLRAASDFLDIKLEFVEKDYWITVVLSRLAKSNSIDDSVFKGGTSLSKGYRLIDRFSEDVDLAIMNNKDKTGNEIKTIIRALEKEITVDFTEVYRDGVTSKGSRFRKSVFEYETLVNNSSSNNIILEINSFATIFPFERLPIQSMLHDFLKQTNKDDIIEYFTLQSFEVNVLSKEQTLLEKMASLIRYSYSEDKVNKISGKLRHFYDLYYLMKNQDCLEFSRSNAFKEKFDIILEYDKEIFDEPKGWQEKLISESLLVTDFSTIWMQLRDKYKTELSAYSYRSIPPENEVAKCFEELIKRIH